MPIESGFLGGLRQSFRNFERSIFKQQQENKYRGFSFLSYLWNQYRLSQNKVGNKMKNHFPTWRENKAMGGGLGGGEIFIDQTSKLYWDPRANYFQCYFLRDLKIHLLLICSNASSWDERFEPHTGVVSKGPTLNRRAHWLCWRGESAQGTFCTEPHPPPKLTKAM